MDYVYDNTRFVALYGDITELDVDAMVVASPPSLAMDGGIALKIKTKGGQAIEDEARAGGEGEQGDVVATGCGSLDAKNIFHCVLLDKEKNASEDALRTCVRTTLQLASDMGHKKIAFPALGSAFPGLSPKASTSLIVSETKAAVESGMQFDEFDFIVCDPAPYRYYKKALKTAFK